MSLPFKIVSPAPQSACFELAGPYAPFRRTYLAQCRAGHQSAAVLRGDTVLAVALFWQMKRRRVQMSLAVSPAAAPFMRALVRMAHLTLARMAEDQLIVISVHPANEAGRRMARLTGFAPLRRDGGNWQVFRRGYERDFQSGQGGEGSGGAVESAAECRQ